MSRLKKNLVKTVLKMLKIMRWKMMKNFQKLTKETFITLVYFINLNVMFVDNFLADLLHLF